MLLAFIKIHAPLVNDLDVPAHPLEADWDIGQSQIAAWR